jgi:hypothetical protein
MRLELIDLFFGLLADQVPPLALRDDQIYEVICHSLGERPAGQPYHGYRHDAGTVILRVAWPRVYDLVSRLWGDYRREGFGDRFRHGVNQILAGYGAAWDLNADGSLQRVLPVAAQQQVEAAFAELQEPRYAPALVLLRQAIDAYNERPRRDRDACTNVFDAMESVAKERYGMPNATFGGVVHHLSQTGAAGFSQQTLDDLRALNGIRNNHFGHGMTAHFNLSAAEVDFVYLSCIGAILLFTRTA